MAFKKNLHKYIVFPFILALVAGCAAKKEEVPPLLGAEPTTHGETFNQAKSIIERQALPQVEVEKITDRLDANNAGTYIDWHPGVILRVEPIRGAPPRVSENLMQMLVENIGPKISRTNLGTVRQFMSLEGFASAATGLKQTTLLINWTLRDERAARDIATFFERQSLVGSDLDDPWKLASQDVVRAIAQRTADRVMRADVPGKYHSRMFADTQRARSPDMASAPKMIAPAPEAAQTPQQAQDARQAMTQTQGEMLSLSEAVEKQLSMVADRTTPTSSMSQAERPPRSPEFKLPPREGQTVDVGAVEMETVDMQGENAQQPDTRSLDQDSMMAAVESNQTTPEEAYMLNTSGKSGVDEMETWPTPNTPASGSMRDTAISQARTVASRSSATAGAGQLTISIQDITGAPGDGNSALRRAITALLLESGNTVVGQGEGDVNIVATVNKTPRGATDLIKIIWSVQKDDLSIGQIVQENEVPSGMFDEAWGENAAFAASGAQEGIIELLKQVNPT